MAGYQNVNNHTVNVPPESVFLSLAVLWLLVLAVACPGLDMGVGCACTELYLSAKPLSYRPPNPFMILSESESLQHQGTMPRRNEDPDWVWRGHPNHRSPPGNGNAETNNPINNITCTSVMYTTDLIHAMPVDFMPALS